LINATFTDESKATVKGPSFVILKGDNPPSVLAAGRKRFKHCLYISRKVNKEGDVRVWLHPDSALPHEKPTVGANIAPKPVQKPAKTGAETGQNCCRETIDISRYRDANSYLETGTETGQHTCLI
jgi:hypothetical protein